MAGMVRIEERLPTPEEYRELRAAVGWKCPEAPDCARALRGSIAGVCAFDESALVGMARLVGDGAFYWYIVDVVVGPDHQGTGIGKSLVQALERLAAHGNVAGTVNLVASPDVVAFYERLGYELTGSALLAKRVDAV